MYTNNCEKEVLVVVVFGCDAKDKIYLISVNSSSLYNSPYILFSEHTESQGCITWYLSCLLYLENRSLSCTYPYGYGLI